jgi:hypothetical protein
MERIGADCLSLLAVGTHTVAASAAVMDLDCDDVSVQGYAIVQVVIPAPAWAMTIRMSS